MKSVIKGTAVSALAVLLLPAFAFAQHYNQTNLITDSSATVNGNTDGVVIDPLLKNSWGLSRGAGTPWWINDNDAGVAELYTVNNTAPIAASQVPLVVTVPPPTGSTGMSAPSGIVFSGEFNFPVVNPNDPNAQGGAADFIFVTEDGTISAWNLNLKNITKAVLEVDNSKQNAVYKGCTIATVNINGTPTPFLYVTNFHSGRVEVYDTNFKRVTGHNEMIEDGFQDFDVPGDFAPFNITIVGGNLFVTYAEQNKAKHDPVGGQGLGFVNVFSPAGRFLRHLEHGPWFDAPWGVALAPRDFGAFSNDILVGNFGSDTDPAGEISAFNPVDGSFIGQVMTSSGSVLKIPNLWALEFGNSAGLSGPSDDLFFTAGPNGEVNGLFGFLSPVAAEANDAEQ
jgi:uncharacterized protein (TIGR03118 family)